MLSWYNSKIIFFVFIIMLISFLLFFNNWFWKIIYPLKYKDLILIKSRKFNLDPDLVAAIIHVESRFKPDARSSKGAIGLMQIMPDTGRWIAKQLGKKQFKVDQLSKPEINVEFGCWYLSNLKQEFGDRLVIVLAAYNAGRGNVNRWLEEDWEGTDESLEDLPYPETKKYIKNILRVYKVYSKLYNIKGEQKNTVHK